MTGVEINVNGRKYGLEVEPRTLLSDALRDGCGLTGTNVGCEHGVCGACTVLIDGRPARSCLMLAVQADGQDVTTIEGLAGPDELNPLQEAFRAEHGLQCGFCTPGILLTLTAYLAEQPDATEAELRKALSGNLCRCTGYQNVVAAALRAAGRGPARPAETGIAATGPLGAAITRREDHRLLTGTGTFVDDIALPGALHACFVRSPHAHASIVSIDTSAARGVQGVVGVFTGVDLAAWTVPLRIAPPIDGLVPLETESLPTAKVRFVGDPVAVVLADSRYAAEDAAALVKVEYESLQPALDLTASLEGRAPLVDDTVDSNVVFREQFSAGDAATAFAGAYRVVRTRFSHQRMTHAPMETRGCAAVWDAGRAELTMYTGTQVPHATGRPPSVGRTSSAGDRAGCRGSFGQKLIVHQEELAVAALARHLNRPVRWREDRTENLTAALSAREDSAEVETAVAADGRILAMRARLASDFGAYAFFPANYMLRVVAMMLPGAYRLADYEYDMTVVLSNKLRPLRCGHRWRSASGSPRAPSTRSPVSWTWIRSRYASATCSANPSCPMSPRSARPTRTSPRTAPTGPRWRPTGTPSSAIGSGPIARPGSTAAWGSPAWWSRRRTGRRSIARPVSPVRGTSQPGSESTRAVPWPPRSV